ncbi:MAG: right-handed parallel beta-helix repeat-containing protein [Terrimicrobiaceae bacterium]
MKPTLKPRSFEKLQEAAFSLPHRMEAMLVPADDGYGAKAIVRGMKRAGKAGIVDLGPGNFEGFEADRHVEILSREPGLTNVVGTVSVIGGPLLLRGLTIQPAAGAPAMTVAAGIVLCEDCEFLGAIEVKGAGKVYLKNCLVKSGQHGVDLSGGALAELITTRISGAPGGVVLSEGSSAALYHCRVEGCVGTGDGETGAGVFVQDSSLYAEGTEFTNNQVGVYLKASPEAAFVGSHFSGNSISAIITQGAPAEGVLSLYGCKVEGAKESEYPALSLEGGQAKLAHGQIQAFAKSGVSVVATAMEIQSCEITSTNDVALDMEGGSLACKDCRVVSDLGTAIRLSKTVGSIQGGTVSGTPPVDPGFPHSVSLNHVTDRGMGSEEHASPELSFESISKELSEIVGQDEVKTELRRLLRLTFAARERNRRGILQEPHQFSGIAAGPAMCGQLRAIQVFAGLLHKLGDLTSPDVLQLSLAEASGLDAGSVRAGFLFVTTEEANEIPLLSTRAAEILLRLSAAFEGRAYIILGGDREALRALLRSNVELAREFPIELPFGAFNPEDLATLFAKHCQREKIVISFDAAKKLPVIFHGLHDRLQRRYLDEEGVADLFSDSRRNYLERCSHAGRFDLELENEDIVVPLDRSSATAIERSAELVTVCSACKEQNPWLPGLGPKFACAHCGVEYEASWGLLKNSTFFRKRNVQGRTFRSGAVAAVAGRRRALPAVRN